MDGAPERRGGVRDSSRDGRWMVEWDGKIDTMERWENGATERLLGGKVSESRWCKAEVPYPVHR